MNIHEKRGKNREMRKGKYDGGYTPTEQRKKDQLMRQFLKNDGPGMGASEAFRTSPVWCSSCGNKFKTEGSNLCEKCLSEVAAEEASKIDALFVAEMTPDDISPIMETHGACKRCLGDGFETCMCKFDEETTNE